MKLVSMFIRRSMALAAPVACVLLTFSALFADTDEQRRWVDHTKNVTITRDDWGVAHVRGKTDADAVFGAIYAQSEDDFNRVETNYINAMGRLAEAEGEK